MKKTVLHIIYNLGLGGAETMLVGVLREFKEYNNIVVTLSPINYFETEIVCDKLICLNEPSLLSLPIAVLKLKKIIRKYGPQLVHSHLPQSNFAARMATPVNIPLVTTIHTAISAAVDYKKKYIRFLDKFTYLRRPSTIVAVSNQALGDYFSVLGIKQRTGPAIVIHTFVDTDRFANMNPRQVSPKCLVMSIGSLRKNKNHDYLITAMTLLKETKISLHIYGQGPEKEKLQQMIDLTGADVVLKGEIKHIPQVMGQYQIFMMASKFEGFSLSVLEAMAAKLPMLLSDIPSFREQCENTALYFDLDDPADCAAKLISLMDNPAEAEMLGNSGFYRVNHNFTLPHYLKQLNTLYESEMQGKSI